MANDQNTSHARRHFHHRGRRGPDRRSQERQQSPLKTPEAGARESRESRDSVDVEQIMRDIRSRIATRHGIELTRAQVQELAARRLDAILEPRHVKPELMEQLRRAAGEAIDVPAAPVPDLAPPLDESALYDSHRGGLRRIRHWLTPILKLFFNPAPIIEAINSERGRAAAALARERELHVRQAQWNALHYEILQRLVLEVSRASIEAQQLSAQVEALSAKLDFNERRLRSLEQAMHTGRPASRVAEPRAPEPVPATALGAIPGASPQADPPGDAPRRRRRRRRGRRPGLSVIEGGALPADADRLDVEDGDIEGEDDGESETEAPMPAEVSGEAAVQPAGRDSDREPPAEPPEPPAEWRREEMGAAPEQAVEPPADSGAAPPAPADQDNREPPDR